MRIGLRVILSTCRALFPVGLLVALSAGAAAAASYSLDVVVYDVTAGRAGVGGSVASNVGIACSPTCYQLLDEGTPVTLTAAAASGYAFSGWGGACASFGVTPVCQFTHSSVTPNAQANFAQTYTLTVSVTPQGSGGGSVTSAPAGIACGSDCTETYSANTQVTLTATPESGQVFNGWSGACAGTGACVVTMEAAKTVTATFAKKTFTLSVSRTTGGSVTSFPAGVTCGTTCAATYDAGTNVLLLATADAGATFAGWSGACWGSSTLCQVTLDAAKTVSARFVFPVTVSVTGTGTGTVTSSSSSYYDWIYCPTDCSGTFDGGSSVTLTPTVGTHSTFVGWGGDCTGTGPCTLTMDTVKSVTATFTLITYDLTLSKAGTGTGTVTSSPTGIACGNDCTETYVQGTSVTLTAAPGPGSYFVGWSGPYTSPSTPYYVTMTEAKNVTATFALRDFSLQVSILGSGSGTVSSSPGGNSCGTYCDERYLYGTTVTLTASPAPGSAFVGWSGYSGACAGINPSCTLTVFDQGSVMATFDAVAKWVSIGPVGGHIQALAVDPITPTTLYVGIYSGGVFKSIDGGDTWSGVNLGLMDSSAQVLAIDPTGPSTLYAGTYRGVFKSTNGGGSWSVANYWLSSQDIQALVLDPTTPTTLYAGSCGGVFKTIDGGVNWSAANNGLRPYICVSGIAVHPRTPTTLFSATGDGLYKSTDGGANWSKTSSALPNVSFRNLFFDPTTPTILYAGTSAGILKSSDGGTTWSATNSGLPDFSFTILAVHPTVPTTLYAGAYGGGVYKSIDGGGNWIAVNSGLTNTEIYSFAQDPTTPTTLYVGTYDGVFKSIDGGASWRGANTWLANMTVGAFAQDPTTPTTLYAGTWGGGVSKSVDSGASWSTLNLGVRNVSGNTLVLDPTHPQTMYAGTSGGLFKSTDGGTAWSAINVLGLSSPHIVALALDPAQPQTVYAGTSPPGVFKSTDGGGTWSAINSGLGDLYIKAITLDPTHPQTIYLGTSGGLFKSTDGGTNWSKTSNGLPNGNIYAIVIHPGTPTTLYAGANPGVFKSTDGGMTWSATNNGSPNATIYAFAFHPITPTTIYAGGSYVVFKSTDGGANWTKTSNGLPVACCLYTLAFHSIMPSTLYVGMGHGVFVLKESLSPSVTLRMNASAVLTGETIRLLAAISPGTAPMSVDLYLAVQLPDGSLLFLRDGAAATSAAMPYKTGWNGEAFDREVFSHQFGGDMAAGTYRFLAGVTQTGTMNFLGEIIEAPFGFYPPVSGASLTVRPNQMAYRPGQHLSVELQATPGPAPLDLYVALQLPDRSLLFLREDGSLTPRDRTDLFRLDRSDDNPAGPELSVPRHRARRNLQVAGGFCRAGDAELGRADHPGAVQLHAVGTEWKSGQLAGKGEEPGGYGWLGLTRSRSLTRDAHENSETGHSTAISEHPSVAAAGGSGGGGRGGSFGAADHGAGAEPAAVRAGAR